MRTSITITAQFLGQQALQRVLARGSGDHGAAERLEHRPKRNKTLRLVVHDENRSRGRHPVRFLKRF